MGGEVLVALLVTVVLGDEVEVLATDDDGAVHLGGDDGTGQDTAADGDLAGEGALLVCSSRQFISAIRFLPLVSFRLSSYRPLPCRQPLACSRAGACRFVLCVIDFDISGSRMSRTRRFAFRNKKPAGGRGREFGLI